MEKAFQFKIQIEGLKKPSVWRRVIVPDTYTFEQFHLTIQTAFGWTNSHLFQFCPQNYGSSPTITIPYDDLDDDPIEDARKIVLKEIFHAEKQKYSYIYDFGDSWHHKITLEAILQDSPEKASCIAGKGKCPPEDCGGVWGYERLKEVLSNPEDPEYEEMREWLGLEPDEEWNADVFDGEMSQVNIEEGSLVFPLKIPEFNHPEVEIFYHFGYDIDRDKLHAIMALPRQTLIEDMQKMLMDSIERFEYFCEFEDFEVNIPMHALYILSSLRAEEALDTLLLIMSQDEDFLDFWYGDVLTEEFWQFLYWMGRNQTDKLKDFFRNPDNTFSARLTVIETITQIALRHPERKQEMKEWEIDAIEYLLKNISDNNIFKPDLLECLTCDLITIGDINSIPLIKRCIASGHVSKSETGTLKEIKENIKSGVVDSYYYEMFELYTEIDQYYDEWEELEEELFDDNDNEFDRFLNNLFRNNFESGFEDDDDDSETNG